MQWDEYIYGPDDWPEEIEAREVVEIVSAGVHDMSAAVSRMAEAIPKIRAVFERFAREVATAFASTMLTGMPSQPSLLYKAVGSPYGRNRRGKKRWLLEMKRQARAELLG